MGNVSMFFLFLITASFSSDDFPDIHFPDGGIFNWYRTLDAYRKPFDGDTFLGYTMNTSILDLKMLANDIIQHMNLKPINVTDELDEVLNPISLTVVENSRLLEGGKCDGLTGNLLHFCEMFNLNLDCSSIGISQEHMNIVIACIAGFIPVVLFNFIISIVILIIIIVQWILLCMGYFKPTYSRKPHIIILVGFIAGALLTLLSAIFFAVGFSSFNHMFDTFSDLDTLQDKIIISVCNSFHKLTKDSIPNAIGPIYEAILNITGVSSQYLLKTSNDFLEPFSTSRAMITGEQGIFQIFRTEVQENASKLNELLMTNANTASLKLNIPQGDNKKYSDAIDDVFKDALTFSSYFKDINAIFVSFQEILEPYKVYLTDLTNAPYENGMTIGEAIDSLKDQSIENIKIYNEVKQTVSPIEKLRGFLEAAWIIITILLISLPFIYGYAFFTHSKFSICMTGTAGVCPFLAIFVMFAICFLCTGLGFAISSVSNVFEPTVDYFVDGIIDDSVPNRKIILPPISVDKKSKDYFSDTQMNFTELTIPSPLDMLTHFVNSSPRTGFAEALNLRKIFDIGIIGSDLGKFFQLLGKNFKGNQQFNDALNEVADSLQFLTLLFPNMIDPFFNNGISIFKSTQKMREEIIAKDESFLNQCEPFLGAIDNSTTIMNEKYAIAVLAFHVKMPDAIKNITPQLYQYLSYLMNTFGETLAHTFNQIYPMLDSVEIAPISGPYALLRNLIFYDFSHGAAYVSLSGHLFGFGIITVVTTMLIRRYDLQPISQVVMKSETELESSDELNNEELDDHTIQDDANEPLRDNLVIQYKPCIATTTSCPNINHFSYAHQTHEPSSARAVNKKIYPLE